MTFLSTLGVVFLVLKLTGVVVWSWWLVLLPFYVVPAIVAAFALLLFFVELRD